jgi:hypothetical protein
MPNKSKKSRLIAVGTEFMGMQPLWPPNRGGKTTVFRDFSHQFIYGVPKSKSLAPRYRAFRNSSYNATRFSEGVLA